MLFNGINTEKLQVPMGARAVGCGATSYVVYRYADKRDHKHDTYLDRDASDQCREFSYSVDVLY